jgi:16S rRNA (guanine966-N2)-methyltransferase
MRIIAGEWRGRPLVAPRGQKTRPTSDRAREGLFSMLVSRISTFEGLVVADLFAGSGALGLEALSRGAAHCLFVDSDAEAIRAIRRNCEALGASDRVDVRHQRAEQSAPPVKPCDLIFLDPPYRSDLANAALSHVQDAAWLDPAGLVCIETGGAAFTLPPRLAIEAERRFGKARLTLLRAAA